MDELRRKMELKALDAANLYYRTGQYKSAIHSYNNFIKDFPSSQDIETVRYNLAKTSYQLAKESTIRKQEERFETAVKYCKAFCKKCKNSDHFKEVSSMEEDSNDKIKILKDR